jgi:hypothetical protein
VCSDRSWADYYIWTPQAETNPHDFRILFWDVFKNCRHPLHCVSSLFFRKTALLHGMLLPKQGYNTATLSENGGRKREEVKPPREETKINSLPK